MYTEEEYQAELARIEAHVEPEVSSYIIISPTRAVYVYVPDEDAYKVVWNQLESGHKVLRVLKDSGKVESGFLDHNLDEVVWTAAESY